MQYLLTKKEYGKLVAAAEKKRPKADERLIQDLCTAVAENKPVTVSWFFDGEPHPWGCILTKGGLTGYCDECPVRDVCPYPSKRWSK